MTTAERWILIWCLGVAVAVLAVYGRAMAAELAEVEAELRAARATPVDTVWVVDPPARDIMGVRCYVQSAMPADSHRRGGP